MSACIVAECDHDPTRRLAAGGLCHAHYRRKQRGLPVEVPIYRRGVDENLAYSGAHQRVVAARGKAAQHHCIDCGAQATEWSYRGGAEREMTDGRLRFSPDPRDYDPRCHSCHAKFDGWGGR